jgi:hypothetical protein
VGAVTPLQAELILDHPLRLRLRVAQLVAPPALPTGRPTPRSGRRR